MGNYTLEISGDPIDDARTVLSGADGIRVHDGSGGAVVVSVNAPTLAEAESKVSAALPSGGTFSVGRPPALEDEDD
jgi:hypothetical protein